MKSAASLQEDSKSDVFADCQVVIVFRFNTTVHPGHGAEHFTMDHIMIHCKN